MLSTIFLVIALILFILAAVGVALGAVPLVEAGLAFFAAGHINWASLTGPRK